MEYQKRLLELIQEKTGKASIGRVLMETLDISREAAYRRYRCEKPFSLSELIKIRQRFNISIDGLLENTKTTVLFNYRQGNNADFSLEAYLDEIRYSLEQLAAVGDSRIILTINNTPFLQLFHFPELLRFQLYFWSKNFCRSRPLITPVKVLSRVLLLLNWTGNKQHFRSLPHGRSEAPAIRFSLLRNLQ